MDVLQFRLKHVSDRSLKPHFMCLSEHIFCTSATFEKVHSAGLLKYLNATPPNPPDSGGVRQIPYTPIFLSIGNISWESGELGKLP
jgi:hypothetical protein